MKKIQNILYPFKKSEMLIEYHLPDTPSDVTLVLGHGKFNDMTLPLFNALAEILPKENVNFVRFNYPFVENPGRFGSIKQCLQVYQAVLEDVHQELPGNKFLFEGGKSLSAVVASRLNDPVASGFVFLTYT